MSVISGSPVPSLAPAAQACAVEPPGSAVTHQPARERGGGYGDRSGVALRKAPPQAGAIQVLLAEITARANRVLDLRSQIDQGLLDDAARVEA